ncbi:MAG TPA: TetR/AcrR family transcriptional regulator [Gemmatimonadales bacterium]|nr:TetR/AcrR family transcriptional regulator [Gemmatimonadales bacterium]
MRRESSTADRILAAARAEFAAHGRAGGRTERIARRAGVNKQLIHYYFRTKDGLYRSALADAAAELARTLARTPLVGLTAVERLRRLLRVQFDLLMERDELTRLLAQGDGDPRWADAAIAPVVALLTEGQATGFFRDEIDPVQHARQALVLQLAFFAPNRLAASWSTAGAWRDATTDLIVRGCTW